MNGIFIFQLTKFEWGYLAADHICLVCFSKFVERMTSTVCKFSQKYTGMISMMSSSVWALSYFIVICPWHFNPYKINNKLMHFGYDPQLGSYIRHSKVGTSYSALRSARTGCTSQCQCIMTDGSIMYYD